MAAAFDATIAPAVASNANPGVSSHAGITVASGAIGIGVISNYGSGNVTAVSISDGTHTYTGSLDSVIANVSGNGQTETVFYFTATNGLSGTVTITVTYSVNPTTGNVQGATTFTGATVTNDVNSAAGTSITAGLWTTPSITTVINGDVVFSYSALPASGGTNTPSAPANDGGQDIYLALQYDIPGTHGAITRSGTWSGTNAVGNCGIVAVKAGAAAPVNTVAPAVTGTAQETFTLTCSTGTWTGDVSSGYAYQWQRDNYGDLSFDNIPGATSSTYVQTIADVDCDIQCVVTATGTGGSTAATSNVVGLVAAGPPDPSGGGRRLRFCPPPMSLLIPEFAQ